MALINFSASLFYSAILIPIYCWPLPTPSCPTRSVLPLLSCRCLILCLSSKRLLCLAFFLLNSPLTFVCAAYLFSGKGLQFFFASHESLNPYPDLVDFCFQVLSNWATHADLFLPFTLLFHLPAHLVSVGIVLAPLLESRKQSKQKCS